MNSRSPLGQEEDMVLRVARALYLHDGGDEEDWEVIVTDRWTARARAAIEAMRIPTEAMSIEVQRKHIPHQGGVSVVWMDMIDAALSSSPKGGSPNLPKQR